MDGSEREVQVWRFVGEVWNGRNYDAASDTGGLWGAGLHRRFSESQTSATPYEVSGLG
jgi:hypothetical protein